MVWIYGFKCWVMNMLALRVPGGAPGDRNVICVAVGSAFFVFLTTQRSQFNFLQLSKDSQ